jgi:ribosomal protein L24E
MRALWWSICHQCGRRINAGDVVLLADRDGHRWWLCRTCGENG